MQVSPVLLPLICAIPLAAALAAYILAWRSPQSARRLNSTLALLSLGVSTVLAALFWPQLAAHPEAVTFSRDWISLPDNFLLVAKLQHVKGEELQQVLQQQGAWQQVIPLQFQLALPNLLFVLTTALIGIAVLLYARHERRDDPRAGLFFAHFTLFSAAMLLLLSADTLLLIYLAWELMGVCSFLLIAHSGTALARRAARQAFWATRATDFGLLLAVIMLVRGFTLKGNIPVQLPVVCLSDLAPAMFYEQLIRNGLPITGIEAWLGFVAICVLIAVIGKSGFFPLTHWLSGAMVAPTPVSAMLHAATMVAAGPYLLYRLSSLFFATTGAAWGGSDAALLTACLVGSITIVTCGLMALSADNAKRVLAYSTASQLGLAVLAVGALSEGAALWQILAHAWAKAALFIGVGILAAGSLRHSTSLGALRGRLRSPMLRTGMWLAALSLAGLPLLPGAQAKDSILTALWTRAYVLLDPENNVSLGSSFPLAAAGWMVCGVLLVLSIPISAAYLVRLVGVLAYGRPAPSESTAAADATDKGSAPLGPLPQPVGGGLDLIVLVLGVTGSIVLSLMFSLGHVASRLPLSGVHWAWAGEGGSVALIAAVVSFIFMLAGAVFAWYFNVARPDAGSRAMAEGSLARPVKFLRSGMLLRQFWEALAGRGGWALAQLAALTDRSVVDALLARGLSAVGNAWARGSAFADRSIVDGGRYWFCELWWITRRWHARRLQNGYIQHYMFIVLIGAVLLCLVVLKPLGDTFKEILSRR